MIRNNNKKIFLDRRSVTHCTRSMCTCNLQLDHHFLCIYFWWIFESVVRFDCFVQIFHTFHLFENANSIFTTIFWNYDSY